MVGIPYRRLIIESALPTEECESRLRAITSSKGFWFKRSWQHFRFIGKISGNGFRLVPHVGGRNVYLPWILGNLTPSTQGTRIEIVQTLHPLAVIVIAALFAWAELIITSRGARFSLTIVFILIVFHFVMYCVGFLPEAARTEETMRELARRRSVAADPADGAAEP